MAAGHPARVMRRRPSLTNAITAALCVATGTTLAATFNANAQASAAQKVAISAKAEAAAWKIVATSGGVSGKAATAAAAKAVTQVVAAAPTTATS